MGRALNATGRDIWYMMCEWGHAAPAEWAADLALANSWRTGNDLMPLFPDFMQVAEGNSRWWQYAKPGHYNDPDDVALGFLFGDTTGNTSTALPPTVSEAEAKLYLGTWAMMKACAALPTPEPARFRLTSSGDSPFILSPSTSHGTATSRRASATGRPGSCRSCPTGT